MKIKLITIFLLLGLLFAAPPALAQEDDWDAVWECERFDALTCVEGVEGCATHRVICTCSWEVMPLAKVLVYSDCQHVPINPTATIEPAPTHTPRPPTVMPTRQPTKTIAPPALPVVAPVIIVELPPAVELPIKHKPAPTITPVPCRGSKNAFIRLGVKFNAQLQWR